MILGPHFKLQEILVEEKHYNSLLLFELIIQIIKHYQTTTFLPNYEN